MRNFVSLSSRSFAIVWAVAWMTVGVSASQRANSVAFAQAVLGAVYPDLKGNVSVGIDTDTDSDWQAAPLLGITVHVADPAMQNHTRPVLKAHLRITGGRLSHALFTGTYVQRDLKGIVAYARKQSDTPERVIEELKKAGVRFMSDEKQFLEAADLQRLEPVIGKIKSVEARFVAVPPVATSVDYEFEPGWVVELHTVGEGNSLDCYSLSVEPLNLRLQRITKRICSD